MGEVKKITINHYCKLSEYIVAKPFSLTFKIKLYQTDRIFLREINKKEKSI